MNEYAIDKGFYNIFEGLNVDEKKIRDFLLNLHELLQKKDEISEIKIREQKEILKAELKNDLTKELATKSDFNEIKKDIEVINYKFEEIDRRFKEFDKRLEKFENEVDKRFEKLENKIDYKFEQVDKKFEKLNDKLDKFLYIVMGFMFSLVGGSLFLLFRFGNFN